MYVPSRRATLSKHLIGSALLIVAASGVCAQDRSAEHRRAAHAKSISTANYIVPAVHLVRDDGKSVSLADEMNDGRPVILNFVFTTCSTICPLMSQIFEEFQAKLGAERDKVHLMSISIDPEEDTPGRLREYAQKFQAGPEWQYYTGTVEASRTAQVAFAVYRGDKMSHVPVTLLRAAPGKPWLRIDGFVSPEELLQQYRQALAAPAAAN